MARGAQDSAEGQIFYLVGHQRRTAWAACVFLPLYGAIGWFYGLRTHPDEMNAAFIMMMSLLIVPSVIFFYGCSRFRVRVDGRGSHWWFFGWHSWTWEDFESGRIFATDVGYKDPGKPWGRRSLPLWYLEDEDRAAVRALCRPHWHRPAPPAPPRSVTLTKFPWLRGWEKLHFHERGIDHTRRGHTQVYSWSDVREAVLLFGEQDVDSPVEYRFSIFGESIEIVMRSDSRWTDRCAAAALIGARMPKTRIRRIYFDEAGQNDEACEEKLRDFRSRLRLMERLCAAGKLFIFSVFVYFCWVALKALLDDPGTDLSFISFLALALAYVFIGWTIQSFQMEGERCALARKIRKLELQLSELRKRHSGPHATKPPAIEPDSRTRGDRAEVLPGGEIFLLAQNTRWMWRSLSGVSLLLAIFLVIRQYVSDPAYMVGAVVVSAIFVSVGTLFLITSFWRVRVDATGVHFWRFFRWHTWQWTAFQSGRIRAKYNGFEDPARHWGQRHLNLAALDARDRARVKDLCRAWWHRPEALPTPPEVSLKRRRLFRTAETIRLHAGGIDHTSGRRKQAYTWNDVRCCCLVYESLDEDGPVECQFNLPDCVLQYNLALGVNWLNRCAVAEIVRAHLPKPCVLLVGLDEMQNCASGCEIQIRHLEERRAHFRKTIRANSIALVLVAAVLLYFLIVCFLDGPGMPMKVPVIILLGAASYFLQSWYTGFQARMEVRAKAREIEACKARLAELRGEAPPLADEQRHSRWVTLVRRVCVAALVMLCALGSAGYLYAAIQSRHLLDKLRAAGAPVTLEELAAAYPPIPGEENAAVIYAQAFASYIDPQSPLSKSIPLRGEAELPALGEPMPKRMRTASAEYLSSQEETLAYLREAVQRPDCQFQVDLKQGYDLDLPHLAPLRNCASLLELEALWKADTGDAAGAAAALQDLLAMPRAVDREYVMLSQMVRLVVAGTGMFACERVLCSTPLSETALIALDGMLRGQSSTDWIRPSLAWERCQVLDVFDNSVQIPALNQWYTLDFFARIDGYSGLPIYQAIPLADTCQADVEQAPRWLQAACPNLLVLDPALHVFDVAARHASFVACMRTAFAVERYRLRKGTLPENLGELVPDFLEAVPQDPFDGAPMRYAPRGKGYAVYTLGPNRRDDGGVPWPKGKIRTEGDVALQVTR